MALRKFFDLTSLDAKQLSELGAAVIESVENDGFKTSSKDGGTNIPSAIQPFVGHIVAGTLIGLVKVTYENPIAVKDANGVAVLNDDGTPKVIKGRWYGHFNVLGYGVKAVSNIEPSLLTTLAASTGQTFPLAINKLGNTVFARIAESWQTYPIAEKSEQFAPKETVEQSDVKKKMVV